MPVLPLHPKREIVLSASFETVQSLPPGTAALEVTDREDGLTEVSITPRRPSAAPVALGVDGDAITVVLGQATTVELFASADGWVDELRALFRCAVAGTIKERVWRRAGRIIRCVSRIVVDGKESRFESADPLDFAPLSRIEVTDYDYDPYVPDPGS